MGYTPNGLFNHTAAIYQLMTGYTTDKVSPSGQLEPPDPRDFPNFGSQLIRLRPPEEAMLPFVMLPRPLQESNVVGKGGSAGFLGTAYDPYRLFPPGDDLDMNKMDNINVSDLEMRADMYGDRLERRARLRDVVNEQMPEVDRAVADYNLNSYYDQALSLIASGRARMHSLWSRNQPRPATCTAATRSAKAVCSRVVWWKPARGSSKSSGRRSPTATTILGTFTPDFPRG